MSPAHLPNVDATLAAALADGAVGPFTAVVKFRRAMATHELAACGLRGGDNGSSDTGYGELDAPAIHRLTARSEVASVGLVPTAARADTARAIAPVMDPALAQELEARPGDGKTVIVTFKDMPMDAVLDALGLASSGGAMASGWLEPDAIRSLAARPEVIRIAWLPPPFPTAN